MRRGFVIALCLVFLFGPSETFSQSSSQALEKVPVPYLSIYDIEDYAQGQFTTQELNAYALSGKNIGETDGAIEAGWNAFNQNFNLQGAGFTFLESCLGASFLKNINSAGGEVGGALVLIQLVLDIAKGDYEAANINFGKGSIYYCIGKWGSTALKVGAIGTVVVEWYLNTIGTTLEQKYDEFLYNVLSYYFRSTEDGKMDLGKLKDQFRQAKINSKEDVLKIIDDYVKNDLWADVKLDLAVAEYKGAMTGEKGMAFADTGMLTKKKDHFQKYVKSYVIMPYLEPFFKEMADESRKAEVEKILKNFNLLVKRLNRMYRMRGKVIGPEDKIQGLRVRMPGFLETVTDSSGQYEFRFTLYALSKARARAQNHDPHVEIELVIPTEDGVRHQYREGTIGEHHHKRGLINIRSFEIEEEEEEEEPSNFDIKFEAVKKELEAAQKKWIETRKIRKEKWEYFASLEEDSAEAESAEAEAWKASQKCGEAATDYYSALEIKLLELLYNTMHAKSVTEEALKTAGPKEAKKLEREYEQFKKDHRAVKDLYDKHKKFQEENEFRI